MLAEHMDESHGETARAEPADLANYISDLSSELARLARSAQFETLSYLLDVVQLEAQAISLEYAGKAD